MMPLFACGGGPGGTTVIQSIQRLVCLTRPNSRTEICGVPRVMSNLFCVDLAPARLPANEGRPHERTRFDMACNSHSTDSESVKPRRKRGPDPDRLARNIAENRARWDAEEIVTLDNSPLHVGLCYFIGATEWHTNGPVEIIKIGYSRQVSHRLSVLRSTSGPYKLTLLATARGGRGREMFYHHKFMEHAVGGEWFNPAPEILAEIARLTPISSQREEVA